MSARDVEVLRLIKRFAIMCRDEFTHTEAQVALDSAIQALEKAGLAVCMWCGAERPSRTETTAQEVVSHLLSCEQHPMRALEAEVATLKARVAELERAIRDEAGNARCYINQGTPNAALNALGRLENT